MTARWDQARLAVMLLTRLPVGRMVEPAPPLAAPAANTSAAPHAVSAAVKILPLNRFEVPTAIRMLAEPKL